MSSSPLSALTLPKLPTEARRGKGAGRGRPVMPSLPVPRSQSMAYDLAAIDQWGRIIARTAMKAMGWPPGTRISYRENAGLVLVVNDQNGDYAVSDQGHLRLPYALRQWHGLHAGTRMLVVGDPEGQGLVIHLPSALDAMIARTHANVLGGGAP